LAGKPPGKRSVPALSAEQGTLGNLKVQNTTKRSLAEQTVWRNAGNIKEDTEYPLQVFRSEGTSAKT